MPAANSPATQEAPAGWPQSIRINIWVTQEEGHYAALVQEFDIVGQGQTAEGAIANAQELLGAYLMSYFEKAEPFEAAKRPVPARSILRFQILAAIARVRALPHRWVGHSRLDVPGADRFAAC